MYVANGYYMSDSVPLPATLDAPLPKCGVVWPGCDLVDEQKTVYTTPALTSNFQNVEWFGRPVLNKAEI